MLYHGNMLRPHGGFAEFAVNDARTLVRHPDVPAALAAATPCAGWTAWRALVDKLHASDKDTLFIAGGAGGVGSFAIQIARALGVRRVITTASAENHDYVRSLGATDAIDYHTDDVAGQVLALTDGQGLSIALDTVGGTTHPDASVRPTKASGRIARVEPEARAGAFGKDSASTSSGGGHRQPAGTRSSKRAPSRHSWSRHNKPPRLETPHERVAEALADARTAQIGKIVAQARGSPAEHNCAFARQARAADYLADAGDTII